jgi:hypothetical protein
MGANIERKADTRNSQLILTKKRKVKFAIERGTGSRKDTTDT